MKPGAALANTLWLAGGGGAAWRFARALRDPQATQARWLRAQLQRHATSAFGEAHDFAGIRNAADYARRVPLTDYDALFSYVARIRRNERHVLSCEPVVRLAPTSGSSGARKLIPFTATLSRGFSRAVSAWMHDLVRQRSSIVGGPAYWSVSPLAEEDVDDPAHRPQERSSATAIPVGFADDAEYLGGFAAALVRQALAAPDSLRHVRDVPTFWALTLLALLRQRELRLVSVWHPSFLELLLESAAGQWPLLIEAIEGGGCPWREALPPAARRSFRARPMPARAAELRRLGAHDWTRWWPRLQVVSCWGDQAANGGYRRLAQALPGVLVQSKGLLATEGVVTIPYGAARPLAVTSHFFEFLDSNGDARLAHQLQRGACYEVVLSNGGGLWRYRLGDMVECTGHLHATPSLRFVGRAGAVSDLRGEKLSEVFVAETLRALWGESPCPTYTSLCATESPRGAHYELRVSDDVDCAVPAGAGESPSAESASASLATRLDAALAANPHYALARRLGQLQPLQVIIVPADTARTELASRSGRLGDAKPRILVPTPPR